MPRLLIPFTGSMELEGWESCQLSMGRTGDSAGIITVRQSQVAASQESGIRTVQYSKEQLEREKAYFPPLSYFHLS